MPAELLVNGIEAARAPGTVIERMRGLLRAIERRVLLLRQPSRCRCG